MAIPVASLMVTLGADGRIANKENIEVKRQINEKTQTENVDAQSEDNGRRDPSIQGKPSGKLIVDEEIAVGRVGWSACALSSGY